MSGPNLDVLIASLRGLRNTLVATVSAIDTTLAALSLPSDPPLNPMRENEECPHPSAFLVSKRSMGHPNRYYCLQCKQDVEVIHGQDPATVPASGQRGYKTKNVSRSR